MPNQPDPPTNDTINARSVLISWMDPLANNAPILRYEVNVYARPFGMVVNRTIVTNISTELLINELLPFVMYRIRVRAANIVGRGELSDPLNITTDEDGKQRVKNEWSSMNLKLMFFIVLCVPPIIINVVQFVKLSSVMHSLACSHFLNNWVASISSTDVTISLSSNAVI